MKTKMPYETAMRKAEGFVTLIRPYCERVEIAGSLRMRRLSVSVETAEREFRVNEDGEEQEHGRTHTA